MRVHTGGKGAKGDGAGGGGGWFNEFRAGEKRECNLYRGSCHFASRVERSETLGESTKRALARAREMSKRSRNGARPRRRQKREFNFRAVSLPLLAPRLRSVGK